MERDKEAKLNGSVCRAVQATVVAALMAGCAAPFSDLQSARLAGEGRVEVSGHYSAVSFADDGESSKVQDNLGLQAAIGVGRLVDMRARYERISVNGEGEGTNVLGIGPKVAFVEDRVAFHLPVGLAFGGGIESSDTWEMHPTILLTAPLDGKLEVNGSAKMLVPLTTGRGDPLVAFNVGLGISSDLTRWALRPEFGVMFNPGESGHFQHVSLGLTIFTGNGE